MNALAAHARMLRATAPVPFAARPKVRSLSIPAIIAIMDADARCEVCRQMQIDKRAEVNAVFDAARDRALALRDAAEVA